MIDLTPLDVRKKRGDFSKGMRGYDSGEVDSFIELVAERLEALVKENLTLRERSDRLGDQVRSLEGRERAVQEALVTAQELREDIVGQARREADLLQREAEGRADEIRRSTDAEAERVKRDAQSEADRVVEGARTRLADLQETLQELERRRIRFLKSFRSLLERELGDVEVEEMRTPTEVEAIEIDLHGAHWDRDDEESDVEVGEETASDVAEPVTIVDVADIAPNGTSAGDTGADVEAEEAGGTRTSTLVYDEKEASAEDDPTVRGA